MLRIFFVFLVFNALAPAAGFSQSQHEKGDSIRYVSYIISYPENLKALALEPLHWQRDQWFQFGGSVVLTGAFIPMDEVLNIPFENWQTNFGKSFGKAGDIVGGLPFQFGLSGVALGVGAIGKNRQWKNFALDNFQAQLFTGGITFFVKEIFQRARPEEGLGAYAWDGPLGGNGNKSFFSGHTALAFSTATMIYLHTGKKWWVGLLNYSLATAVGLSRMQQQKHWASDVVAGTLIGIATSQFIYHHQQKRRKANTHLKTLP